MISLNLGYPPIPAVIIDKHDKVLANIHVGYPLPQTVVIPTLEETPLRLGDPPLQRPRFGQRSFLRVGRIGRVIQYLE